MKDLVFYNVHRFFDQQRALFYYLQKRWRSTTTLKMNILPKKSWHVRTNKNIERVKRDEAQAAEENKKRQERAALAEQEARTALLRRKARQLTAAEDPEEYHLPSGSTEDDRLAVQTSADTEHVDLFSDLSTEKQKGEKNKEREKEEKAAQEKYEQKIGLLTYLGQSSAEALTATPWYFKSPDRGTATSEPEQQSCKEVKRKASLDPMMQMEKYLGVKKSKGDTTAPITKPTLKDKTPTSFQVGVNPGMKSTSKHRKSRNASQDDRKSTHRSHKSKQKHKHKHKRDKDKSERSKEQSDKNSKKKPRHREPSLERRKKTEGPNVQQLREERLRREAAERAKTTRLLSGEKLEGGAKRNLEEEMERPGRYNSQYHPELARKRHRQAHYGGI
ncbi:leukocyte receptor cluster member 1-like [Patiria miniata]|uniref:CBF1-interacting co-repressor CIR N-terminal domain-containing protein n=1 Tax=Patiria miniata TaxID=46514 RepID=A0A914B0K2_PATMI|nr:leukocyte receptor cluster member 1-like [Patiria miniata]